MIRPAITPRRITGNATTGLVSAARSGVRNVQRSTNTISKAPDVTKEQRFGMNYVEFFGSKKTYKVLEKSMKTIRNSMVSTFAMAKELKESVTEGKGVLGFVGKIIGFAALAIPFLPFLLPLIKVLAIAGIGGLLIAFKDQIFDFFKSSADRIFDIIKSKAAGFKSFIRDSIEEFFISNFKTGQFQQTRKESEDRLNERLSKAKTVQDIERAEKEEIRSLEIQKKKYQEENLDKKDTEVYRNQIRAYDDRITEIKTGKVPADLDPIQRQLKRFKLNPMLGPGQRIFEKLTTTKGEYPKNYLTLTRPEKFEAIKKTLGVPDKLSPITDDDGNLNENIIKFIQTYQADLKRGDLSEGQTEFAENTLTYLKEMISSGEIVDSGKLPYREFLKTLEKPTVKSKVKSQYEVNRSRGRRSFSSNNKGNNVSVLPMGGKTDTQTLVRNDIGSGNAAPSMSIWSNYDPDNFVAAINKSSLNVV